MKNARLILLVVLAVSASLISTVHANAQTTKPANSQSTNKSPKVLWWWCWASQLNAPNNAKPARYYSDAFSGAYTRGEVGNAFRNYLHKTYLEDEQAGGIGPGECGSYTTQDLAQNSLDRMVNATDNTFNSRPITTGWVYGAATGNGYWFCLYSGFISDIFPTGPVTPTRALELEVEFKSWLVRNFNTPSASDPRDGTLCYGYRTKAESENEYNSWIAPSDQTGDRPFSRAQHVKWVPAKGKT